MLTDLRRLKMRLALGVFCRNAGKVAVTAQGVFFGLGQMQGLGLQHLHGMGFIMAKLEAPDGLPIFSAPSYIEIVSTRAGVGAGFCLLTAWRACFQICVHSSTEPCQLFPEWRQVHEEAYLHLQSREACVHSCCKLEAGHNSSYVCCCRQSEHRDCAVCGECLHVRKFKNQRQVMGSELVLTGFGAAAGKVKTEIVHFAANVFTLDKFQSQRQVMGSELGLTDFDESEMSVQSVLDFMAAARADNKHSAVVSLRAREGTTLNLLRLYGQRPAIMPFSWQPLADMGSIVLHSCFSSALVLLPCQGCWRPPWVLSSGNSLTLQAWHGCAWHVLVQHECSVPS